MSVKWQKVKLGEICSSVSDGDHLAPPKTDVGIPFVTISDIKDNRFDLSHTRFVSEEYYQRIDEKRKVHRGDVLYSVVGSYGIPVFADTDLKIAFQRHIAILRPSERLCPKFLYYSLKNPKFYKSADGAAVGSAQKTISLSSLRRLEIDVPSLPVQKKIASILSAYDDLIENNRRRIAILEEMARKEFDRIVEHARGVKTIPEVIEIDPVVPKPKSVKVRYVPMSSLSTSGMAVDLQDCEMRQSSTSVRFVNGDTLLARITPCLENGKTGFVNFLDEGEIACGSSEFIVLRGKTVSSYFVYCVARMERFRGCAINSMVGASGRQRVQPACFNDFVLSIPTVKELSAFDLAVKPMFDQIGTLLKVNMKLAAARDALLPKLMSGNFKSID